MLKLKRINSIKFLEYRLKMVCIATIFTFGIGTVAFGQTVKPLIIPKNIQQSYKAGIRSYNGVPGEKYWVNRSAYTIKVQLNPSTKIINGNELVTYFNESPDTLNQLVIRLYYDLFKKGTIRNWPIDSIDVSNGVVINELYIDGKLVLLEGDKSVVSRKGTNMFINLENPILPSDSVVLQLSWQEQIPSAKSAIRMGYYDSNTYHIAYWYPQIAVYDDIDGWDSFNYTGIQEFYNDFSDFTVEITVPDNFMVWGTGRLQNVDEVLMPKYSQRYFEALNSDEVIPIITKDDLQNDSIIIGNKWNTFKYKAANVPDFAFSISDQYLWDMTSVKVSEKSEQRILVSAVYNQESKDFSKIAGLVQRSIQYFSSESPSIPFPYESLTAFNGDCSMEYPMMVNLSNMDIWSVSVYVTSHEVFHTYFPFMMGINERKYAWMDEGWATMMNTDFRIYEVPEIDPVEGIVDAYLKVAGSEFDLPMMIPTVNYGSGSINSYNAYENSSYYRPGVAYYLLEQMVGKDVFLNALHEYINHWKGKHPIPYDFFFSFNNTFSEDLSWFWKPWFFDFAYPDLGLKIIEKDKEELTLEVVNIGGLPLPVELTVFYNDGNNVEIKKSMREWKDTSNLKVVLKNQKNIVKIELGNNHIPDVSFTDNVIVIK